MNNVILVVLYKEVMSNTETYQSILKSFSESVLSAGCYEVVFWDNSPDGFDKGNTKESIEKLKGFGLAVKYYNSPENMPLSAIYNRVLDDYHDSKDYLLIFDQDSKFDGDYFVEFEKTIAKSQCDIILPVIKYKNKIVSPTRVIYLKGFYFKYPPRGSLSISNLSAINSGMIVSLKFICANSFRYNSHLKNYCTDDDIMLFARKIKAKIYILNFEMEHDLSFCTLNINSDGLRERYNEMVRAKKIIYSRCFLERIFIKCYFLIHGLYMAFKYSDIKYLKG